MSLEANQHRNIQNSKLGDNISLLFDFDESQASRSRNESKELRTKDLSVYNNSDHTSTKTLETSLYLKDFAKFLNKKYGKKLKKSEFDIDDIVQVEDHKKEIN